MNDQRTAGATVRVDLHCHSAASAVARLGATSALALPECATPPRELYELAKRRGMDFVTITDHDTIVGVLELADEPDVFISEELTAWFKDEPQAVHVLCYGITPEDHEWLQAHNRDVESCAEYLHRHQIACALAHPFVEVAAPLTAAHRRTLAELFPAWETRNGLCAPALNSPAAIYIETHGGIAIGGSDDHAGVDIGRTYTAAPHAATPAELLEHIRAGRVAPHGKQGSAAEWAHSALVRAARALAGPGRAHGPTPAASDQNAAYELARRLMLQADPPGADIGQGLGPAERARLLKAWLGQLELDLDSGGLIALLQEPDFRHSDLERRARRVHERGLTEAAARLTHPAHFEAAAGSAVAACLSALPYVPAAAFIRREQGQMSPPEDRPVRIAVIADGLRASPGLARTLAQLRERAIPGYEIELIGTDPTVDRRLAAVTDVELPFYPGLTLGVPSLFAVTDALTDRHYDLVHICAPGPTGIAALVVAEMIGLPVAASHHADLLACAHDPSLEQAVTTGLEAFYGRARVVLSPSRSGDASLVALGVAQDRIARWEPGIDRELFNPARYEPDVLPASFNILYAGRLSREQGIDLLAEAFLIARDRDHRLRLVLAGGGPDEPRLRARLGSAATFLGWLDGERLAAVYASADLLVFPSATDTFGQVILEAQASGLPVLAVDAGGPAELIESGRNGCLVAPEPDVLAGAIRGLARRETLRDRLSTGGLVAVRERSWERSLSQLAAGYAQAVARAHVGEAAGAGEVARAA